MRNGGTSESGRIWSDIARRLPEPDPIATATPLGFCLCADDYAIAPGVSRGILEALDARALSATSVMTTSVYWEETAGALQPFRQGADIGLHLNLTAGRPLGPMPRLALSGTLPGLGALLQLAYTRRLPEQEIAAEIDRQCERFFVVFGAPPSHVDGHQHVQAIAAVRNLLLKCLARRGWSPWIRDSSDRPDRIAARRLQWRKALVVAAIGRGAHADVTERGIVSNDGFAGFSAFQSHEAYAALFASYLRAPGSRHLVMCHPGHVDDALKEVDPVHEAREEELRFLLSPQFRHALAKANAHLVRPSLAWFCAS